MSKNAIMVIAFAMAGALIHTHFKAMRRMEDMHKAEMDIINSNNDLLRQVVKTQINYE